ncbi:probable protein phosphatase 2C 55 [Humulus lupulus]|uniref:probable protein phosphatase 2C 55 n=1 Tax=Humulus lupulus TaxID=3486 RepID=UPI002B407F9E|nr:probable protein phosphatase 2C 55 [Humulus lupulus]
MEIDHEMKMVCECYYIPKDEIIGEDAHFVCEDKQIIGVADGIGGWAKRGIDAGEYARQLMNRCINAIVDNDITHPRQILEEAFMANAKANIQGSSTACILRLNNGVLHAVNVGDSGFMLFRNNKFIYRSPTQQWRFNAPYQLGNSRDTPECAVEVKIAVIPGDIIILGTDGLFDNMFVSDIEEVLRTPPNLSDAFWLAEYSRHYSLKKDRKSPFSEAATKAGQPCTGGKFDDITVIVARIVSQ